MKKFDPSIIRIKKIEVLSFGLNKRPLAIGATINYGINLESQTRVNPKANLIFVINKVAIVHKDSEYLLFDMEASVVFELDKFNEAVKLHEENYVVDPMLEKKLQEISFNTFRGTISSYLEGTYLQFVILPIIESGDMKKTVIE